MSHNPCFSRNVFAIEFENITDDKILESQSLF